jgi:hypothetical protein
MSGDILWTGQRNQKRVWNLRASIVGFDLVGYNVSLFFRVGRSEAQNQEEYILYKATHKKVSTHLIVEVTYRLLCPCANLILDGQSAGLVLFQQSAVARALLFFHMRVFGHSNP